MSFDDRGKKTNYSEIPPVKNVCVQRVDAWFSCFLKETYFDQMPWKLFKMWNRIYTIHILTISITFVESVQCRYAEIVHVCARCTFQRDQDELQRIFQSVRIASEQTLYKMYLL